MHKVPADTAAAGTVGLQGTDIKDIKAKKKNYKQESKLN